MANEEHVEILKQGVEAWNAWRRDNPTVRPNRNGPSAVATDLPKLEERACYAHGDRLGIVLWDTVESDWAFVALQDEGDGFRACSADVGFPTLEAAEEALGKTLAI